MRRKHNLNVLKLSWKILITLSAIAVLANLNLLGVNLKISEHLGGRRLDACYDPADPPGLVVLYILGILYFFIIMAIVADELFVPALEVLTAKFKLSPTVAGATFMAAGGSAPELATSMAATFLKSDVGFGTVVRPLHIS